jgi:hypothetical protein
LDLVEIGLRELDWIGLAQDRYKWTRQWNFRFHNILGKYRVATQLL